MPRASHNARSEGPRWNDIALSRAAVAALAPFVVRSRVEIVSACASCATSTCLSLSTMATTPVSPSQRAGRARRGDELIVDLTVDAVGRQAIAAAEALVMVGFVDNVKLQFSTRRAQALTPNGAAFRVPLPQEMLRLQRRSSLRVKTPALLCRVPKAIGSSQHHVLRVSDIGLGAWRCRAG